MNRWPRLADQILPELLAVAALMISGDYWKDEQRPWEGHVPQGPIDHAGFEDA